MGYRQPLSDELRYIFKMSSFYVVALSLGLSSGLVFSRAVVFVRQLRTARESEARAVERELEVEVRDVDLADLPPHRKAIKIRRLERERERVRLRAYAGESGVVEIDRFHYESFVSANATLVATLIAVAFVLEYVL